MSENINNNEIIVRNKNNKIKIILNNEYLTLKHLFYTKKIKRENIKSALIVKNSLLLLTFDNKVIRYTSFDTSDKYMQGLKILINNLKTENLIFKGGDEMIFCYYYLIFQAPVLILNIFDSTLYHNVIYYINIALIAILYLYNLLSLTIITYNIDTLEFTKIRRFSTIKKQFSIDDVQIRKPSVFFDSSITKYRNIKDLYNFKLENETEKIVYPLNCVNALNDLNRTLSKSKIQ